MVIFKQRDIRFILKILACFHGYNILAEAPLIYQQNDIHASGNQNYVSEKVYWLKNIVLCRHRRLVRSLVHETNPRIFAPLDTVINWFIISGTVEFLSCRIVVALKLFNRNTRLWSLCERKVKLSWQPLSSNRWYRFKRYLVGVVENKGSWDKTCKTL